VLLDALNQYLLTTTQKVAYETIRKQWIEQNEAEEAQTKRETQSSLSSSYSVTEEPVLPGTGSRYHDMFNMPEVPADQPAQNVADNPRNQNIDQPVVAPDIIQIGNVVAPEPAIKKRHIEENSTRTAGLFNMAKLCNLLKETYPSKMLKHSNCKQEIQTALSNGIKSS
jgi:hypothetical protein